MDALKPITLALACCLVIGCSQQVGAPAAYETQVAETQIAEQAVPPIAIELHISNRFAAFESVDYLSAIVEAAEEWNRATAGRTAFRTQVVDADAGESVFVRPATSEDVAAHLLDSWSLGSTACIGCYPTTMLLNLGVMGQRSEQTGVPGERLAEVTAMHELGHVLGLWHADQGLMYKDTTRGSVPCIDAVTLDAFCTLHGCPPGAAPTC